MMVYKRKKWLYRALVVQRMFHWEYLVVFSFWKSRDRSLDRQGSILIASISHKSILDASTQKTTRTAAAFPGEKPPNHNASLETTHFCPRKLPLTFTKFPDKIHFFSHSSFLILHHFLLNNFSLFRFFLFSFSSFLWLFPSLTNTIIAWKFKNQRKNHLVVKSQLFIKPFNGLDLFNTKAYLHLKILEKNVFWPKKDFGPLEQFGKIATFHL